MVDSRVKTHVFELSFSVHLKTSSDCVIDSVINVELLSSVLWVSLESRKDFSLFGIIEFHSWNDSNFLFFVYLLIKLGISLSNSFQIYKSFVFSKNFQKFKSLFMEISNIFQTLVECLHFSHSDTSILGEESEIFWIVVEVGKILEVLVNVVKSSLFGCRNKQNVGVSTFDCVFLRWWSVISNFISDSDISNTPWSTEKVLWDWLMNNWSCLSFWWSWSWLWCWFNMCFFFNNWLSWFIIGCYSGTFLSLLFGEFSLLKNKWVKWVEYDLHFRFRILN